MISDSLPVLNSSSSSSSIDSSNIESRVSETFFEKVVLLYFCDSQGKLINYKVYHNYNVDIAKFEFALTQAISNKEPISTEEHFHQIMDINERYHEGKGTMGLVTKPLEPSPLNLFMTNILLSSSKIKHVVNKDIPDNWMENSRYVATSVVELFAKMLKNTSSTDAWKNGGQDFFQERIEYFTSRYLRIECVLPAFPCKSSNLNKVAGWLPDKGEEMAMRKLCDFVAAVRQVYTPGIVIWIVSDGHVFSDCIGVDDLMVNKFGKELRKMYQKIKLDYQPQENINGDNDKNQNLSYPHDEVVVKGAKYHGYNDRTLPLQTSHDMDDNRADRQLNRLGKEDLNEFDDTDNEMIKFTALTDIFSVNNGPVEVPTLEDVEVPHHVETQIDPESELCRKLLTASCDTDCGQLKRDINTPNHPRLSLYRGFAKFMEEDLTTHPTIVKSSKKRYKKIVSKVAFEMIKRNDAYSNLVELMFPLHVRFSIHAHNNQGPKFGIKLLDSKDCQVVKSLEECNVPNYDDLLHIPTPWHNTILQYESEANYFITKARIIHEALNSGSHVGYWDEDQRQFYIKRVHKNAIPFDNIASVG